MKRIDTYIIEKLHLNKDIEIQSDYNKIIFYILYYLGWNMNPYNGNNIEYTWFTAVKKFIYENEPRSIVGYIKNQLDFKLLNKKYLIEKEDGWTKLKDFYIISSIVEGMDFDLLAKEIKRKGKLLWQGSEKLYMYDQYLLLCEHREKKYPPIIIKAE